MIIVQAPLEFYVPRQNQSTRPTPKGESNWQERPFQNVGAMRFPNWKQLKLVLQNSTTRLLTESEELQ